MKLLIKFILVSVIIFLIVPTYAQNNSQQENASKSRLIYEDKTSSRYGFKDQNDVPESSPEQLEKKTIKIHGEDKSTEAAASLQQTLLMLMKALNAENLTSSNPLDLNANQDAQLDKKEQTGGAKKGQKQEWKGLRKITY